jgi:hypothetical protein
VTPGQAGEFYDHLNGNRVFVRRHPIFDAFWTELKTRFPGLSGPDEPRTDVGEEASNLLVTPADLKVRATPEAAPVGPPDQAEPPAKDDAPWAATLAPVGFAVALPIRWSRVDEVVPDIFTMVRRHGLVIYNPQEHWVWCPPKLRRRKLRPAPLLLRLQIAGRAPDLVVTIHLAEKLLLEAMLPSRREAHARARALALENGLAFYDVDDPGSLAQSLVWVPIEPGDSNYPPGAMPDVHASRLTIRDDES